MRHLPQITLGLLFTFVACALLSDSAFAQASGEAGSFSCAAGKATGQLYSSGTSCPTTLGMSNLFSFLVCNMEQLSSDLMGHMYCGMIHALSPAVWAAATLAVFIFGISFTIGLIPATGRDAIIFLLKLAFITGFATNADLLIGTGYRFLMVGIKEGVEIILGGIGGTAQTGGDVFAIMDNFLAQAFHYATDSVATIDPADRCKNAIFAVMATMVVAFPMIAYLGLLLLARIVVTFLRATFGYVYAMVGITFLLTLAPFFLTFYLFKQTSSFFDRWLGYLVSFALQVILLFAFLAFVLSIEASSITSKLTDVIMPKDSATETTAFRFPWQYCTLCEFDIVDKNDTSKILTDKNSEDFIKNGQLQCKEFPALATPKNPLGHKPIDFAFAMSPQDGQGTLSSLITFAGAGIFSLIALAVMVERLLAMVPYLAQRLAGGLNASYAPQIGGGPQYPGGSTTMRMPGDSMIRDFGEGFNKGFGPMRSGDSISKTKQGVKDGFAVMITGRTARTKDNKEGETIPDTGIVNSWMRYFSDPNRDRH